MITRLLLLLPLILTACRKETPTTAGTTAQAVVFTVNAPLADFARYIGGDFIDVRFPAPPEIDPAFWNPDPETIIDYQNADLILMNGANYAKWTANASLPLSKTIDCSHGLEPDFIELDGGTPHTHGPTGEHEHGELAFTLWLDPQRASKMASNIEQAFSTRWPAHSEDFANNLGTLQAELKSIDQKLEQTFEAIGNQPIVFSHPVYQYLEDRYAINGRSLHWEPGEEPTELQWKELDQLLASHPAKLMIWEATPLAATAGELGKRGISSVVFDPAANHGNDGDFISIMQNNLKSINSR